MVELTYDFVHWSRRRIIIKVTEEIIYFLFKFIPHNNTTVRSKAKAD